MPVVSTVAEESASAPFDEPVEQEPVAENISAETQSEQGTDTESTGAQPAEDDPDGDQDEPVELTTPPAGSEGTENPDIIDTDGQEISR